VAKKALHSLSIRFPLKLWEKILKRQKEKPYLSLNAIVVEACQHYIEKANTGRKNHGRNEIR